MNQRVRDWLTVFLVVWISLMLGVAFWLEPQLRKEILTAVIAWGRVDLRVLLQEQELPRGLIGL